MKERIPLGEYELRFTPHGAYRLCKRSKAPRPRRGRPLGQEPGPSGLSCIYVIGPASGPVKVGHALDPVDRLATLQTASPYNLTIHFAHKVNAKTVKSVERQCHAALADFALRGEWFDLEPSAAVAAISSALGLQ